LLSQNYASFIGINGKLLQHTYQSWWDKKALKHATNCGTNVASTKLSGGVLPQKWQYPNREYSKAKVLFIYFIRI